MANNFNEAETQAWPVFVDILSSTLVVIVFAVLILVLVLSVTKITSSTDTKSYESSPSAVQVESNIIGDFRNEFQQLSIISNPSSLLERQVQSDQPTNDEDNQPYYTYKEATPVESPQEVKEVGPSDKEILGDIPKYVDSSSVEVLKEFVIQQQDVIEQQRKVIEQRDIDLQQTVREYQSLLSLQTKSLKEIEEIRQQIVPRDDQATFNVTSRDGEMLSGPVDVPDGFSYFSAEPELNPRADVAITEVPDGGVRVTFNDNANFLREDYYNNLKNILNSKIDEYKGQGVLLEAVVGKNAPSGASDHRIAINRLLVIRSALIELGVSPNSIKLKTVAQQDDSSVDGESLDASATNTTTENQETGYGWVNIKTNN